MSDLKPFPTHNIARVPFQAAAPLQAARWLAEFAPHLKQGVHVHLANAYTLAIADRDAEYRGLLTHNAINFPDGRPLALFSRARRDKNHLTQVRGPQFMLDVLEASQNSESGAKHYFLGSTDEVLESMARNLQTAYPDARIVGIESPPFRPLESWEREGQAERIRRSGAHIVWVGLGTPKQDYEVRRLSQELPIAAVAVGAAFDFAAGTLKPAPRWVSWIGLEWAHRFAAEPRRLWKRYIFGNPRFVYAATRWGRRGNG